MPQGAGGAGCQGLELGREEGGVFGSGWREPDIFFLIFNELIDRTRKSHML